MRPSERAPDTLRPVTIETGAADRPANMQAFAKRALELLLEELQR